MGHQLFTFAEHAYCMRAVVLGSFFGLRRLLLRQQYSSGLVPRIGLWILCHTIPGVLACGSHFIVFRTDFRTAPVATATVAISWPFPEDCTVDPMRHHFRS